MAHEDKTQQIISYFWTRERFNYGKNHLLIIENHYGHSHNDFLRFPVGKFEKWLWRRSPKMWNLWYDLLTGRVNHPVYWYVVDLKKVIVSNYLHMRAMWKHFKMPVN